MKAKGYKAGKEINIDLIDIDLQKHKLHKPAARAFIEMRSVALQEAKIYLIVNSAFRSMEEQTKLYRDYMSGVRKDIAAKPGWSNHQSGTALDIATARGTNKAFHWLTANAARFGFKRTVKSEPWHWEYVGT